MSNLEKNWFKKFLRQPNMTRPTALSNLEVLRIFLIQLFPNWPACSPTTYTNQTRSSYLQYKHRAYNVPR